MSDQATLGIFLLLTLAFPVGAMVAARLFRAKPRPSQEKLLPYECGVDTKGPSWMRYRVNYFLYALVFLAFDVETIFLFPWAV
ncbi:MAG TPA: NADH-quinone oxidoreductase subunit A, partial [Syntrophomonas sp.]|nr:NADH-quinone oxidoreductase subunit A [Syntrophomonas sp.]